MNVILESGKFKGTSNEFKSIVNNILLDNYLLPATLILWEYDDLAFYFVDTEEFDCITFPGFSNENQHSKPDEDMVMRSDAAIIFCNGDLCTNGIVSLAMDARIDIWLYDYNLKIISEV